MSDRNTGFPPAVTLNPGLDISNNRLTTLPDWLGDLSELSHLDVRGNPLVSIPSNLVSLSIDQQQWERFKTKIINIKTLQYLDISNNQLTTVPDWLESLPSLTFLNLRKTSQPEGRFFSQKLNL